MKILFLYSDPHYLHAAFARSVAADFLSNDFAVSWTQSRGVCKKLLGFLVSPFGLPRGYDVHLSEGPSIIPVIARKMRLQDQNCRIINFVSDPLVYYLYAGVKTGIKRRVLLRVLRETDGFICVGNMERELLLNLVDKPVRVVDPFIPEELYSRYLNVAPELDGHNLLFIGKGPDWFYKGLDLLIEGFKIAKRETRDLRLSVVGSWSPRRDWLVDGVEFAGSVDSLVSYMKKSSLYVHIGRGEAFGISVLEAMLCGIPAIVSRWTGAKEVVQKLGPDFVSDVQPADVAGKITKYFSLSSSKRRALSRKARTLASEYRSDKKIELFKIQFQKLLGDLN